MQIHYDKTVEKYFLDFSRLQKKIPFEWVRKIKKLINQLKASNNFGVFISLGLGKPEQLKGYHGKVVYSLHITGNTRLIIELLTEVDNKNECTELNVKGVCDYHGGKESWYIP